MHAISVIRDQLRKCKSENVNSSRYFFLSHELHHPFLKPCFKYVENKMVDWKLCCDAGRNHVYFYLYIQNTSKIKDFLGTFFDLGIKIPYFREKSEGL